MVDESKGSGPFKAQDKTLPFKGEEAIDAACLECFEYAYADKPVDDDMEMVTKT
ncbi:MAG: hypothetical protein IIB38_09535, partial [Candidatus Hydrogenedentes bacterium]|nr:hypothetical protein [Candidatus Hydrogenedentota bacterium]